MAQPITDLLGHIKRNRNQYPQSLTLFEKDCRIYKLTHLCEQQTGRCPLRLHGTSMAAQRWCRQPVANTRPVHLDTRGCKKPGATPGKPFSPRNFPQSLRLLQFETTHIEALSRRAGFNSMRNGRQAFQRVITESSALCSWLPRTRDGIGPSPRAHWRPDKTRRPDTCHLRPLSARRVLTHPSSLIVRSN